MANQTKRTGELPDEWRNVPAHPEGKHLGYERDEWDCMISEDGEGGRTFIFVPEDSGNEDEFVSAKLADIDNLSRCR